MDEIIKAVESFLKDIFYEEWMDQDDYLEFIKALEDNGVLSKQKLIDDVLIGVKNGYSVKQQLEIAKKIVINLKK